MIEKQRCRELLLFVIIVFIVTGGLFALLIGDYYDIDISISELFGLIMLLAYGLVKYVAIPGVVGYLLVGAMYKRNLNDFSSSKLRGFVVGAFVCGSIGAVIIYYFTRPLEVNGQGGIEHIIAGIFMFVVSSFIVAFFGGIGGALAMRKQQKLECEHDE